MLWVRIPPRALKEIKLLVLKGTEMSLHVQVRRSKNLLSVAGQWESGLPLFQNYTLRVVPGQTAAETVELDMMDMNLAASWSWSKRTDSEVLEGEFVHARHGSHKEVKDSNARNVDL